MGMAAAKSPGALRRHQINIRVNDNILGQVTALRERTMPYASNSTFMMLVLQEGLRSVAANPSALLGKKGAPSAAAKKKGVST